MWNLILALGVPYSIVACFNWYAPNNIKKNVIKYRAIYSFVGSCILFIFFIPLVPLLYSILMTTTFSILWMRYVNDVKKGKIDLNNKETVFAV